MLVRVMRGSDVPISRQIMDQIRAQCLSGAMPAGSALPSVRQLASELAVNVNTVFRIYERLAGEGVLEMRQGEGTFVAPSRSAPRTGRKFDAERAEFAAEFRALVQRGLLWGFSGADLQRMVADTARDAKQSAESEESSD